MTTPALPPGFVLEEDAPAAEHPPLPPGFVLESPNDSAFAQMVSGGAGGEAAPPRVPSRSQELMGQGLPEVIGQPLHYVENGMRAVRQGLSLGFSDELAGVGGSIGALLTGEDPVAAYREDRDMERARLHQFERDYPAASFLGNVGGGLLTGAAPARAVAGAPSVLARVAKSIPTGAAYGGVAGLGVGEGNIEQQVASAGKGAALGAIAAPVVTAGAAGLGQLSKLIPRGPVTRTVPTTGAPAANAAPRALPESGSLATPYTPTAEQMRRSSRVEEVALDAVRSQQRKMGGRSPGALVEGFGDLPVAVRLRNGEVLIYDGNHRTAQAIADGKRSMRMHVIDAADYDPEMAGRAAVKARPGEDDDLLAALGAEVPVPASAPTATSATRAASGPPPGVATVTARDRAMDFVADTLRRSGVTPEEVERQLVSAEDLGLKPEMLADFLGDQGARRLYSARTLGGQEAAGAVERLAARGEGTAARVSEDVQRATAPRGQSLTQLDERMDTRRRMGNTMYQEAFGHGEVKNPGTIALVQNPRVAEILKKASDRRAQVADLRGEAYAPLFKQGEAGPVLARTPTVEDLHLLKTSLDDDIQQAFKAGEGQLGKALRDFKNRLVRNLEDEVPAYRKARETYKGDMEVEEAITNGRADILRKPVDELRRDFAGLSAAEQDAYRSGAIDTILARKVDPKVDSADFARSLWGNADSRNRLQLLVKDEAELVRLARQFEREQRMARTNRGVLGGSQTAMRAADIEDQTAQTLADVATQGPSGAFVSTVGRWIRRAGGMTEAVADDVAKLLTSESPETIRAVMASLKERDQLRIAIAMRQTQAAKSAASTSAQQTNGNP